MDEINGPSFKSRLWQKMLGIVFVEPTSFSSKKGINFRGLGFLFGGFLVLFCVGVLFAPSPQKDIKTFNEHTSSSSQSQPLPPPAPNPLGQNAIHAASQYYVGGGGGTAASNRNTTMIIARDNDISTTLPPGTKFWVVLKQAATVTNKTLPVIGRVAATVEGGNSVAIPEDSQVFGEASIDMDSERASITWKSILFPDGRSKSLTALALGSDNQAGVEGNFHSDALKNTAGELVGRFVGGVAEGAITRTPFGASQGGIENGLLQGVADTAKDRTNSWSEDMKKPRAWIELEAGTKFQVILSQPFTFKDPGGVN